MSLYTHYPVNTKGRDFVVGDIHGCFDLLSKALRDIGFDPEADRLFSVGDLVDRGPQSAQVGEWLAQPWFHPVRGNHEQMAIDYLAGEQECLEYRVNGGRWFIDLPAERQADIARMFGALPIAIDVETRAGAVGIVHADCPFDSWQELIAELDGEDAEAIADICMWSRERFGARIVSGVAGITKIFVGHTPVDQDLLLGNVHFIDTGACFRQTLSVLPLAQE